MRIASLSLTQESERHPGRRKARVQRSGTAYGYHYARNRGGAHREGTFGRRGSVWPVHWRSEPKSKKRVSRPAPTQAEPGPYHYLVADARCDLSGLRCTSRHFLARPAARGHLAPEHHAFAPDAS